MSNVKKSSEEPKGDFYKGTNTFILPNGDTYMGEYLAHASGVIWREGSGVYQTEDGHFYEGIWRDDNLIDGEETTITYSDKSQYQGPLVKNKYHGPCSFTLSNGKKVFTECNANKVIGEVSLADVDGRLWHGEVTGESVYLHPENLFFQNITAHRGKRRDLCKNLEPIFKPKSINKIKSSSSSADPANSENSRELERERIFGRINNAGIDYTDSSWFRNFENYKAMRKKILNKLANSEILNKQELKWYNKYAWSKRKMIDCNLNKPLPSSTDTSLLYKFYSKSFKESSKPYTVIYPSSSLRKEENPESLEEEEIVEEEATIEEEPSLVTEEEEEVKAVEEQMTEDIEEDNGGKTTVAVGTDSLYDFVSEIFQKKIDRKCNEDLWSSDRRKGSRRTKKRS